MRPLGRRALAFPGRFSGSVSSVAMEFGTKARRPQRAIRRGTRVMRAFRAVYFSWPSTSAVLITLTFNLAEMIAARTGAPTRGAPRPPEEDGTSLIKRAAAKRLLDLAERYTFSHYKRTLYNCIRAIPPLRCDRNKGRPLREIRFLSLSRHVQRLRK